MTSAEHAEIRRLHAVIRDRDREIDEMMGPKMARYHVTTEQLEVRREELLKQLDELEAALDRRYEDEANAFLRPEFRT